MATRVCLTLSTQTVHRWGCQDAASPCFWLNPGQVLWPSYSRRLGRDAFRWADEMGLSNANTPKTSAGRCCLMRGCMMPGICGAPKEVVCCHSLFPAMVRRQKCWSWSTIMPVESAEVARHPYRCRITWIYLITWMVLVGLMAARPHDRKKR